MPVQYRANEFPLPLPLKPAPRLHSAFSPVTKQPRFNYVKSHVKRRQAASRLNLSVYRHSRETPANWNLLKFFANCAIDIFHGKASTGALRRPCLHKISVAKNFIRTKRRRVRCSAVSVTFPFPPRKDGRLRQCVSVRRNGIREDSSWGKQNGAHGVSEGAYRGWEKGCRSHISQRARNAGGTFPPRGGYFLAS